jgi:hypothetical protein
VVGSFLGLTRAASHRKCSPVRRVTAIVAADAAGYSRLMGADEKGHARTAAGTPSGTDRTEDRQVSRPDRQDTGNGLLAEFASAADAAQCAVEDAVGYRGPNAMPWSREEFNVIARGKRIETEIRLCALTKSRSRKCRWSSGFGGRNRGGRPLGPDWMPITRETGSLFHADSQSDPGRSVTSGH